ncbi:acyl-CoA thioesterase [Natrononativus amylolyticus]|uniref:acyl-CoA thioesterase n=1 Tax=Natrononativus amylolyticus TaxID=2963434 RepID=UPI0020CFA4E3|nr:thioesterase family protein [Natrononativus amylolyticus]
MTDALTVDVSVRYRDLDTLNHVNNGVYASYLEEARFAYLEEVLGGTLEEYPFVVAHIELSFERPVTLSDDLTVGIRTANLGETSWTQAYDLRVDGETVATGETTMVSIDPAEKRPSPIPDDVRERVVAFEGLETDG